MGKGNAESNAIMDRSQNSLSIGCSDQGSVLVDSFDQGLATLHSIGLLKTVQVKSTSALLPPHHLKNGIILGTYL